MTQFIDLQIQGATQLPQIPLKKEKLKATTQAKSTTATNNTTQSNQVDEATENDKGDQTTAQRASRNSPIAEAAINGAINAIIAHNNATDLHDLKWAISINAVKELVSDITKSQRLVDKVIVLRKDEIDAHHALHQLEPNHNHRHKRKRTIREAISFPSAQT